MRYSLLNLHLHVSRFESQYSQTISIISISYSWWLWLSLRAGYYQYYLAINLRARRHNQLGCKQDYIKIIVSRLTLSFIFSLDWSFIIRTIFTYNLTHLSRPKKCQLMHKPFKFQKKQMTNQDETIRIASYMQRSIASGRSSYVEMRAASRVVAHNMKAMINYIKSAMNDQRSAELLTLSSAIVSAYEFTLTPNGKIRQTDLEELISADTDITVLLSTMQAKIKTDRQAHIDDEMNLLKNLLNRRLRLVERFKA
jgi:predicted transcriptional regulator